LARFKGYFRFLATLVTYHGEHLALGSVAVATTTTTVAFRFPGLTAGRTALGLVGVAFGLEKFLFLNGKGEFGPAIGTLESLFFKAHRVTSSLLIVGLSWSSGT
tara:strand:+ start:555 stop:866 length:312 start_codon:yes stop_codon:yes gene_type:complete